MKRKLNILSAIVMLFFAAFVIIYKVWNEPHKNIKDATAEKITSVDLYNKLANGNAQTNSEYRNKIFVVSGIIKNVLKNNHNQQVILLETSVERGFVNCTMEEEIKLVNKNDQISLKGICTGYINGDTDVGLPGDVFLIRCYQSN